MTAGPGGRRPVRETSAADVEELRADARAWLADQAATAPPDYGAICPPELIEEEPGSVASRASPTVLSGAD